MRKHVRTRVRTRGRRILTVKTRMVALFFYSQTSLRWREWTFRTVSMKLADGLVKMGEAAPIVRMYDGDLRTVGYRALKPLAHERQSPTTLTYATMRAVSNQDSGASLSWGEREEIIRFKVWPLIGDTKAVAVRPRMTDAERKFAESLLATGGRSFRSPRAA